MSCRGPCVYMGHEAGRGVWVFLADMGFAISLVLDFHFVRLPPPSSSALLVHLVVAAHRADNPWRNVNRKVSNK